MKKRIAGGALKRSKMISLRRKSETFQVDGTEKGKQVKRKKETSVKNAAV